MKEHTEALRFAGEAALALAAELKRFSEAISSKTLTVAEAAKRLKVAPNTIYRMVSNGELTHHRVGRNIRIAEDDLYTRPPDSQDGFNL